MNYYYNAHTHITTIWIKTEHASTLETPHVPLSLNSLHAY